MKNVSVFQIVILSIFVGAAMIGLIVFAFLKKSQSQTTAVSVVIWGTYDQTSVSKYIADLLSSTKSTMEISYKEYPESEIYTDYLEAVANGNGPDALLLSQDQLATFSSKLDSIPYTYMPISTYEANYVQESQLYMNSQGLTALPFVVDPLVMYWNKDIFNNASLVTPPSTWEQFLTLTPLLTVKNSLTVSQSAVGLGEYANVNNAKDILSTLIMQAGNPIATMGVDGYQSTLAENLNYAVPPAQSALSFFTEFSDPTKQTYTWNSSMPDSLDFFTANDLAIYFGYGGEYQNIKAKNPNLNFAMALMPQPAAEEAPAGQTAAVPKMTFGHLYGFSISRDSRNPTGTLQAILFLTNPSNLGLWSNESAMPSAALSQLKINPTDPNSTVLATSALWSRGWYDPNTSETAQIFQDMVENVTSGRLNVMASIANADSGLEAIFNSTQQASVQSGSQTSQ
jgi:ABC-type glycerol-3-phosphate transport system substrate-binding protein